MEKNPNLPKNKTVKTLMYLADHAHRWSGAAIGMPGTGKTTFLKLMYLILQSVGRKAIFIQAKECSEEYVEIAISEQEILSHISGVLQFTANEGFKPSFDRLAFTSCDSIDCLIGYVEKRYREDIADWIIPRLMALRRFVSAQKVRIPLCLMRQDELIRRITVGILYAIRPHVTFLIILDDAFSFVVNEMYKESFLAMMRPYLISLNRYLMTEDLLRHNPAIITPGGAAGLYRIARPDRYVVIFDQWRWELPRKDVEKIVSSYS